MINNNKTIINNSNTRNLILTEETLPDITTLQSNITTEGNTNRSLYANNTFKYNTNASTSTPLNPNSITIHTYTGGELKDPNWVKLDISTGSSNGNTSDNIYDTSAKYAVLTLQYKSDDPPVAYGNELIEIDWGPNLDTHHYKVLYNIYSSSGTTINSYNFEWWRGRTTMYLRVYHSNNYDFSYWVQIRFVYLD